MTGRQGRRRTKLLDDLKERRGYSHLKEEGQEDKEEDVRSYWMTLRKGEDTLI